MWFKNSSLKLLEFENLTPLDPTHASHQISWRSAKDGSRCLCRQSLSFWQYLLIITVRYTRLICQNVSCTWNADTMVLTGNNAVKSTRVFLSQQGRKMPFSRPRCDGEWLYQIWLSQAVGKPDQFKKDIYNLTLEAQPSCPWLMRLTVQLVEVIESQPRIPIYHGRKRHGCRRRLCASLLNLVFR